MSQSVNVSNIQVGINGEDKKQIDNLIRIMAKAKVELVGVEILAASDAMRWLSSFQQRIEKTAIATAEAQKKAELEKIAYEQSLVEMQKGVGMKQEPADAEPTVFARNPNMVENLTKGPFNTIEERVNEAREQLTRKPKGKK